MKRLKMSCYVILFMSLMFFSSSIASAKEEKVNEFQKDAQFVGAESCSLCHDKETKEFRLSTHARINVKDTEGTAEGCEMCHGPGSTHVDNGGGKGTMINPRKNPEVCFSCHMDKKMEFRLPYRHPVLEVHMSCADCHNLHGVDARPWTATSMDDANEVCFKCHKDKRGPFTWEHQALRDGCTTCHKVHGSITDKMLVARDANLCLRCHVQTNFPKLGANYNHATYLPRGTCWSAGCHTAIHGSYFERYFRDE